MSVVGAALIPAAPVLVRGLSGSQEAAQEQRAAALGVLRELLDTHPERIVVIAQGDPAGEFDESCTLGLHRLGGLPPVTVPATGHSVMLPIPLAIAAALLGEAGWNDPTSYRLISASAPEAAASSIGQEFHESTERIGLLILGNASACSTPKAPGSFHPDSAGFNARLVELISGGSRASLAAITKTDFEAQLSDLRIPLLVLSGVSAVTTADIDHAEEFMGVFYVCATFRVEA